MALAGLVALIAGWVRWVAAPTWAEHDRIERALEAWARRERWRRVTGHLRQAAVGFGLLGAGVVAVTASAARAAAEFEAGMARFRATMAGADEDDLRRALEAVTRIGPDAAIDAYQRDLGERAQARAVSYHAKPIAVDIPWDGWGRRPDHLVGRAVDLPPDLDPPLIARDEARRILAEAGITTPVTDAPVTDAGTEAVEPNEWVEAELDARLWPRRWERAHLERRRAEMGAAPSGREDAPDTDPDLEDDEHDG